WAAHSLQRDSGSGRPSDLEPAATNRGARQPCTDPMLRYGAPGHEERFVTSSGPIARLALALTAWSERWIPDAFIFALLATFIVLGSALVATPASLAQTVDAWGRGFWELIPFTLQMSLIIITGHVLATSKPMGRVIHAIAGWPSTPQTAVALVTFF